MAAVCDLRFLKVRNFTVGPVQKPNVRYLAKTRADSSNRWLLANGREGNSRSPTILSGSKIRR